MAKHKDFMRMAIEEAKKSQEPLQVGVVVVKDGEVISRAFNSQRADNDPSAHAEIKGGRDAGQKLGTKYLHECIVYSTHEPCVMCLAALSFSEVKGLVYGIPTTEYSPKGKTIDIPINEFMKKTPRKFAVLANFMIDEIRNSLK